MHIHSRNNPAKFHPDRIWNDGASDFFKDGHPNENKIKNKMSSDMRSVPDIKQTLNHFFLGGGCGALWSTQALSTFWEIFPSCPQSLQRPNGSSTLATIIVTVTVHVAVPRRKIVAVFGYFDLSPGGDNLSPCPATFCRQCERDLRVRWLYLASVRGTWYGSGCCERRWSLYDKWSWDGWTERWVVALSVDSIDRWTETTPCNRWERPRTSYCTARCRVGTSRRTSAVYTSSSTTSPSSMLSHRTYRVGQKSKPAFCNNFVYCQPIFIIFDTYTL